MITARNSVITLMAILATKSLASLPATEVEYAEWELTMLTAIREQKSKPPPEAIEKLGRWVFQMSLPTNLEKEKRPVFNEALSTLQAIPGHAEYYRDKILAAQVEVKEHLDSADLGARLGRYTNEKSAGFETLKHVPSAETVRVLGEMLADDWTGGLELQENVRNSPLSTCAVVALGNLPIVSKPFPKTEGYQGREQLEGWRQWYGEIKAGKRTFRFTGSDVEYGPDGPATPEHIERARVTRARDEKRASGHASREGKELGGAKELETTRSSPLFMLISAATAALASIVWYFRRKKAAA
jgi:hypothetical protein